MSGQSLAWPAVGVAFVTWVVSLGGLASLQADCSSTSYLGVRGFSSGVLSCRKLYRYYWFIVAFEFVIIAGLAASLAAGLFRKTRLSWLGLFSVGALLYIQATDSFLTAESLNRFDSGSLEHRARTTTAGYLMTAVANAFVIIVLGLDSSDEKASNTQKPNDPVHASAV